MRALTELGHHVDELPQAPFDDAALAREFLLTWFVYTAWELAEAKRLTGAGDESFERDTLIMAALGRATSSVDYVDAVQRRHEHTRRLTTFFESLRPAADAHVGDSAAEDRRVRPAGRAAARLRTC